MLEMRGYYNVIIIKNEKKSALAVKQTRCLFFF